MLVSEVVVSPKAEGYGMCHHYGPGERSIYWITAGSDWCGEWEPKVPTPPDADKDTGDASK